MVLDHRVARVDVLNPAHGEAGLSAPLQMWAAAVEVLPWFSAVGRHVADVDVDGHLSKILAPRAAAARALPRPDLPIFRLGVQKNLFMIGRKGHEGDENQLTEMLAYLFQEEAGILAGWLADLGLAADGLEPWQVETQRAVPGGILDLVLYARSQALVIVESKLGSTTDFDQIAKYLEYAKSVRVSGPRALVFMTQHPEPWPVGVAAEAGDNVQLIRRRWQALADFLLSSGQPLALDFVSMLEKEGLVKPNAMTVADWHAWREGFQVSLRLGALLKEAGPALQAVAPAFKKLGAVNYANTGAVYRPMEFEGLSAYVGFWPSRAPTRPTDHALVTVYVLNTRLPVEQRKAAGQAAVEQAASERVAMSGWSEQHIVRTAPAQETLTSDDFDEQCSQLAEHVREAIEYFQGLGYLSGDAAEAAGTSGEPDGKDARA